MDMARISLEAMQREHRAQLRKVETSLASLKNQDGEYATEHRKLIACRQEVCGVIERHLSLQTP